MENETEKTTSECQTNTCCQTAHKCQCGWFRICNFLIGVLFIATALIAFRNPVGDLFAIAIVFGIMAILSGLWSLTHIWGCKLRIMTGLVEIVIGVLFLTHLGITAAIVPFVFAAWFICNSITNFTLLPFARRFGWGHFWFFLIMGILGMALGIGLFFQPVISMLTLAFLVGFYLLIVGLIHIVLAFSSIKVLPDVKDM